MMIIFRQISSQKLKRPVWNFLLNSSFSDAKKTWVVGGMGGGGGGGVKQKVC
jgi:hypothetical protein